VSAVNCVRAFRSILEYISAGKPVYNKDFLSRRVQLPARALPPSLPPVHRRRNYTEQHLRGRTRTCRIVRSLRREEPLSTLLFQVRKTSFSDRITNACSRAVNPRRLTVLFGVRWTVP